MSQVAEREAVRETGCKCGPKAGCPLCTKLVNSSGLPPFVGQNEDPGTHAYEVYKAQNSFLLGKVLTVVEAAILDRGQLKAVKDLIRQQFREQEKWVYSICCDGTMLVAEGEEMKPV